MNITTAGGLVILLIGVVSPLWMPIEVPSSSYWGWGAMVGGILLAAVGVRLRRARTAR